MENVALWLLMSFISAWAIWQIKQKYLSVRSGRKIKKAYARAKEIGPLFRCNDCSGVLAICKESDFSSEYDKYCKGVEEKLREATDKVVIHPLHTFTFWTKDSAQTMMHTGSMSDMEKIAEALSKKIIGITREEAGADWQDIMKIIIIRDGRLFVPFSGGMPNLEEQKKLHKREPLDFATVYLMACTPSCSRY